jgi:hypothetical protein
MAEPLASPVMPPGIQSKCDAQLQAIWPEIESYQDSYFVANGCYWQGLITHHAELPANGTDVLPDVGDLTPTDLPVPWPDQLIADPRAEALVIDAYEAPAGHGYVLTALVNITPTEAPPPQTMVRWQRAQNVGPEEWRTSDWQPYEPDPGMS